MTCYLLFQQLPLIFDGFKLAFYLWHLKIFKRELVIIFGCISFMTHLVAAFLKLLIVLSLTFTTLWANSAEDKLMIFYIIFPRKQVLTIHANSPSLHELSNPVFWEK